MKLTRPAKRRDVVNPYIVFRSAITGRYVPRWWALLHPDTTVAERRW